MTYHRKLAALLEYGAVVALTLGLMYWLLAAPHFRPSRFNSEEACRSVRSGMSLQQALREIHSRSDPQLEELQGNVLAVSSDYYRECRVVFTDGRVTSKETSEGYRDNPL